MKLVFRYFKASATELLPDLSLREYEEILNQGSVHEIQEIQDISSELVNLVVNDNITYWNVPRAQFEVLGSQDRTQPLACCNK